MRASPSPTLRDGFFAAWRKDGPAPRDESSALQEVPAYRQAGPAGDSFLMRLGCFAIWYWWVQPCRRRWMFARTSDGFILFLGRLHVFLWKQHPKSK